LVNNNGGHNEQVDLCAGTINHRLRGLGRSSRAPDGFAITNPIGNRADGLHQCWSALPLGPHLGLHSKRLRVCAVRCLLWRSLEIPNASVALALLSVSALRTAQPRGMLRDGQTKRDPGKATNRPKPDRATSRAIALDVREAVGGK